MKKSSHKFAMSIATFGVVFSLTTFGLIYVLVPPGKSTGYNWLQVLPNPPIAGSGQDIADKEAVRHFQGLKGGARWQQATEDATADIFNVYRPIIGPEFTPENRPEIVALSDYAIRQLNLAGKEAKRIFARPRPFVAMPDLQLCVPDAPADYSYPSGHAALGWLSARLLTRIEPTYAQAILARGREFGESRLVCGVHYPSDVAGGRYLADIMLEYLDKDAEFQRLLLAAKHRPTSEIVKK